jgi:hypothetical protein
LEGARERGVGWEEGTWGEGEEAVVEVLEEEVGLAGCRVGFRCLSGFGKLDIGGLYIIFTLGISLARW